MEAGELPAGWVATSLSEISSKLVDGSHNPPAKQAKGLPMLSAVNINDNKILFSDFRWITEEGFRQEDQRTKIVPGDVLLTIVGAIGRTAVVPEGIQKFTLQRSVAVISPVLVSPKFLMYQIESPRVARYFTDNARGTAQKGVYLKTLGATEICLPPLAEQHRIVAKIEELFSELDQGVASLKTAREQLKVYRQSLLKNAFEGKLTAAWRAAHADQLETAAALQQRIARERQARYQQQLADWQTAGQSGPKPKPPKPLPPLTAEELAELPELPAGWGWARLEALVSGVDQGWSPKCDGRRLDENEWAVIKTTAIQHGRFDELENKALPPGLEPRTQHELQPGDILVTRAGPRVRVGVCCLVRSVKPKLMNCDKAYRVRALSSLSSPEFLEAVLNSPRVLDVLERIKSGINDSGVNLNQGAFLELAVPFCGLREQQAVVQELESKLSEADQLDQTLATALQQADALRQSILKKAFHGQLEKQDKNEEPASALLERIRAEKSNGMNTPRNRRKPG
jgi:type I restriction enzyme S subunit